MREVGAQVFFELLGGEFIEGILWGEEETTRGAKPGLKGDKKIAARAVHRIFLGPFLAGECCILRGLSPRGEKGSGTPLASQQTSNVCLCKGFLSVYVDDFPGNSDIAAGTLEIVKGNMKEWLGEVGGRGSGSKGEVEAESFEESFEVEGLIEVFFDSELSAIDGVLLIVMAGHQEDGEFRGSGCVF